MVPITSQNSYFFWLAFSMLCALVCAVWFAYHQHDRVVKTQDSVKQTLALLRQTRDVISSLNGSNDRIWQYAAVLKALLDTHNIPAPTFNQYVRSLISEGGPEQVAEATLSSDSLSPVEIDFDEPESAHSPPIEALPAEELAQGPEDPTHSRQRTPRLL